MRMFFWRRINYIITILLLALSAYLLFISPNHNDPIKGFLINISAGFVTALITILGIDGLRRRRLEIEKEKSKKVAQEDLRRLSNMCMSHILSSLEIITSKEMEGKFSNNPINEKWSGTIGRELISNGLKRDLQLLVSKITPDKLRELKASFNTVRTELNEDLSIYGVLLPENIYGELLNLKRSLKNLMLNFQLFEPFLFLKGSHGEYGTIASACKDFAEKADDFTLALDGWR